MAVTINASTSTGLVQTADLSGNVAIQNNGTTAVTVTSGNVGIGTTSPNDKLDVNGNMRISGAGYFSIYNADNTTYSQIRDSGGAYVSQMEFYTAGVERMRIDNSGNLLVGTTSNPNSWKLNVNGTIGANAISMVGSNSNISVTNQTTGDARPAYFANNNASGLPNGSVYIYNTNDTNSTGYNLLQCTAGSTVRFIVYGNGAVNATGAYTNISDARIKKDIVDATPKLDKLMQVRVVNYTRTDHPDNIKEIGVISQELEQIFPNLIMEVEEKDKDNNVTCPDRKLVKYSVFVPILIKAMQEQQALIESLTTRLTALEAK